jgi:hypothetical protein
VRVLLILVPIVLAVYALVDCVQTERPRGLPKFLWFFVIVLVPVVGPLAWLLGGHDWGWQLPMPKPPKGPLAPDDDPEFLRKLRDRPPPRRADTEDDGPPASP